MSLELMPELRTVRVRELTAAMLDQLAIRIEALASAPLPRRKPSRQTPAA